MFAITVNRAYRIVPAGSPWVSEDGSGKNLRQKKCPVTLCVLNHSYYQQTFCVVSDVDSEVDHFTCRKTKRTNVGHIEAVTRIIYHFFIL